jgi:hypothetical protein
MLLHIPLCDYKHTAASSMSGWCMQLNFLDMHSWLSLSLHCYYVQAFPLHKCSLQWCYVRYTQTVCVQLAATLHM